MDVRIEVDVPEILNADFDDDVESVLERAFLYENDVPHEVHEQGGYHNEEKGTELTDGKCNGKE